MKRRGRAARARARRRGRRPALARVRLGVVLVAPEAHQSIKRLVRATGEIATEIFRHHGVPSRAQDEELRQHGDARESAARHRSFHVIRSRALHLELASHSNARARATGSSTRRANERSALEMSTADASSGARASNSRASSNDDDSGGVSAAFALALSVVSSVSLVIVNKHLISALGFREGARRGALVATRRDATRRASGRPENFPGVGVDRRPDD